MSSARPGRAIDVLAGASAVIAAAAAVLSLSHAAVPMNVLVPLPPVVSRSAGLRRTS
jgi:hypothetical protein